MHLRYRELLQLLERLHTLPRGRGVATESRIKNFSRLDFPAGPKVGSGERVEYGAEQIVQLLVAFELLRLRVPPAAIAELVRSEWPSIAEVFAGVARKGGSILDRTGRAYPERELLLIDAVALHEAGKTVRRDELLTVVDIVSASEMMKGEIPWRSALLIDPGALLSDAAEQLAFLRRPADPAAFMKAVADLPASIATAGVPLNEEGYSRRRALADVLRALREPPPESDERRSQPGRLAESRTAAALVEGKRHLANVRTAEGWPLGTALAVYLEWTGDPPKGVRAGAADTLAIRSRSQTPAALHASMVETVVSEIGAPGQDL